eukprot:5041860-Prymnesium_polylepis.1
MSSARSLNTSMCDNETRVSCGVEVESERVTDVRSEGTYYERSQRKGCQCPQRRVTCFPVP